MLFVSLDVFFMFVWILLRCHSVIFRWWRIRVVLGCILELWIKLRMIFGWGVGWGFLFGICWSILLVSFGNTGLICRSSSVSYNNPAFFAQPSPPAHQSCHPTVHPSQHLAPPPAYKHHIPIQVIIYDFIVD